MNKSSVKGAVVEEPKGMFNRLPFLAAASINVMFFKKKAIPLQHREALGFRGARKVRSCFKCGLTDMDNYDPRTGQLYMLEVVSKDKNFNNTEISNHYYSCRRCKHAA